MLRRSSLKLYNPNLYKHTSKPPPPKKEKRKKEKGRNKSISNVKGSSEFIGTLAALTTFLF